MNQVYLPGATMISTDIEIVNLEKPELVYMNSKPGQYFQGDGHYYIKPVQNGGDFHIQEVMIDLFSGDVVHVSRVSSLRRISYQEIMW